MNISIEKPEESIWKFPCLGKSRAGVIVYFSDWKMGVVVEPNDNYFEIGHTSASWHMDSFTPIDINGNRLITKPKTMDWDKVELPIWFMIDEDSVLGIELWDEGAINWTSKYDGTKERDEFLNSLEILPKGTKITLEL